MKDFQPFDRVFGERTISYYELKNFSARSLPRPHLEQKILVEV